MLAVLSMYDENQTQYEIKNANFSCSFADCLQLMVCIIIRLKLSFSHLFIQRDIIQTLCTMSAYAFRI